MVVEFEEWQPLFGQWYHIAIVRNGGVQTVYVDGQDLRRN